MVNEHIPGVVGEIDTPEEVDAMEEYVEKKLDRSALIILAVAGLALIISAGILLHPDTVQGKWNALPWPHGIFSEPNIIERSTP